MMLKVGCYPKGLSRIAKAMTALTEADIDFEGL